MENKEEILEEIIQEDNLFNQEEQTKEQQRLYDNIVQSGMLYTKKGRKILGVVLKPFKRESPKIGRNKKCPCGSNKKYKKCCQK